MTHQRPALFGVDIRLGEGKRKGQRWNKEMTVVGFRTQSLKVKPWEITITSQAVIKDMSEMNNMTTRNRVHSQQMLLKLVVVVFIRSVLLVRLSPASLCRRRPR